MITKVLEKIFESPLDCKEIKPVNPKGNQSWIFIGRIDAEAETLVFWPPDARNWLIRKDPDAWKEWRQEEKGITEDEMVGWHHQHDGYEFWESSRREWRTGKPGVLQSTGSQRVWHNWVTERKQQRTTPVILQRTQLSKVRGIVKGHQLLAEQEPESGFIFPCLMCPSTESK